MVHWRMSRNVWGLPALCPLWASRASYPAEMTASSPTGPSSHLAPRTASGFERGRELSSVMKMFAKMYLLYWWCNWIMCPKLASQGCAGEGFINQLLYVWLQEKARRRINVRTARCTRWARPSTARVTNTTPSRWGTGPTAFCPRVAWKALWAWRSKEMLRSAGRGTATRPWCATIKTTGLWRRHAVTVTVHLFEYIYYRRSSLGLLLGQMLFSVDGISRTFVFGPWFLMLCTWKMLVLLKLIRAALLFPLSWR